MPRLRFIAVASLCVTATLPGLAQGQATAPEPLSPTQEKEIREFVLNEGRTSAAVPAKFKLLVGATLPQSVEFYPFDADLGAAQFRYTIIGGRIVVVDPGSRRIMRILE
jgi:Protein of unknown function (DUF1236)